jgi:hypothetical protein
LLRLFLQITIELFVPAILLWGVIMKTVQFAIAASLISAFAFTTAADAAVCSKKYFTGEDRDPIWWQGRDYAQNNWSDKVAIKKGVRWSKWSKARNKDENCDWLPTKGVNYCVARAQPCR